MKYLLDKPYLSGISILECLLALTLVFGVAAGMIGYFKATSRTQRITDGIVLSRSLLSVAGQYWQSNLTFDGLDNAVAIQSGLLPVIYTKLSGDDQIATPWTEISSQSRVNLSGSGHRATLIFTQLPNHACQPFGQQLRGAGYQVTLSCGSGDLSEMDSTVTLVTVLDP